MLVLAAIVIITLPIRKVADCRCFQKWKEHEGIFYSHLCEIDCSALLSVHAAPPPYYTDTHTHSHIPLFRRGKTININNASAAAALQQQASLISPLPWFSHTLHHKHTIGKGQRPSYYFGIETKKHGLTNKFTKKSEMSD